MALIRRSTQADRIRVKLGDALGAWRVVRIDARSVVLREEFREIKLRLEAEPVAP
jgi:hypothetical protein